MAAAVHAPSSVVLLQVYYCGGINKSNTKTVSNCAIYDPKTDKWTSDSKKAPNMPKGRNHAAACTDGKKLFVFGGRSGKNVVGTGFADTQILEPGKGWKSGKDLPLARGGTGKAVFHKGKCYVFGGEVSTDVKPSTSRKIETTRTVYRVDVYDIANDSWSQAKVRRTSQPEHASLSRTCGFIESCLQPPAPAHKVQAHECRMDGLPMLVTVTPHHVFLIWRGGSSARVCSCGGQVFGVRL